MSFTDKSLACSDCGQAFVFTAGEQEFYANKGYTNEPKRCPTCRANRKAERGGGAGGAGSGFSSGPRQMYAAVCASCGKDAQVPFQPRSDRPVYCSDCYATKAPARPSGGMGGGRGGRSGGDRW